MNSKFSLGVLASLGAGVTADSLTSDRVRDVSTGSGDLG